MFRQVYKVKTEALAYVEPDSEEYMESWFT